MKKLSDFKVSETATILEALKKIDSNKEGFLVVLDVKEKVMGVITDGDIRRSFIAGKSVSDSITGTFTNNPRTLLISDDFNDVIEIFKNQAIKFVPIIDESGLLKNIITKKQMHALLLQDIHADLSYDFSILDTSVVDHEIFQRPWGYYKTTVLNDYFQAKIISVKPGGQLSLQSHNHREEYWIVVHGNGAVQLDKSEKSVSCGSTIFIPLGCKHRLTNTDEKESLIITEVQIGDYFGEDDIIRYEDVYGRI